MVKSLNLAIQFLSKLPTVITYQNVSEQDMANSVIWYPLVGTGYGLLLLAIGKVLPASFPVLATGILLVAAEFLVSGGLHYDGLSDFADGWFSGKDTAAQLAIMKDSRSGVMGITVLILIVLGKVIMLSEFGDSAATLVAYGLIGKQIIVVTVWLFPYARVQGTGKLLQKVNYRHVLLSLIWLMALGAAQLLQPALLLPLVIAFLITTGIAVLISRRYQGLTGDCYGALHEIAQLIFLQLVGGFR